MRAFHTNWTAPFYARNPDAPYAVEPFELLTTALSALSWRQLGGTIAMCCDTAAAAYYRAIGLDTLWDDGIYPILDQIPSNINPNIFWAAGKLFALKFMRAPCIMMDTDFIVWRPIEPLLEGAPVAVIHREDLMPDVYPGAASFSAARDFCFDELNWAVRPANTALAYFGDENFKNQYADCAIRFMRACPGADNSLTYMVFAEQRLLAMLAADAGLELRSLSDLAALFGSGQQYFTHIWGFKQQMRDHPPLYEDFCRRCAARLSRDFPLEAQTMCRISGLSDYFPA